MSVNAAIAHVILEMTGFQLKTPRAEFGAIKSELQPTIAVLECRLIVPPFGEQGGKTKRARRYGKQAGLRSKGAVGKTNAQITKTPDAEGDRPDDRQSDNERCRCGKYGPAASSRPNQQRQNQGDGRESEPV